MFNYSDYIMRPLKKEDKDLIFCWRNLDFVRENMYTNHVISQEEHDKWFVDALEDKKAVYFIFVNKGMSIGFISFTNISQLHSRASWAFYIGEAEAPIGSGAVMEYFAIDYAFLVLKIYKLCCEVFEFNSGVIKLHKKFGFLEEGRLIKHYKKSGNYENIICLAKFSSSWAEERVTLKNRLFGGI